MVRWKHGWKALAAATALVSVGCASGPPPRELLEARSAYQELSTSPEGRERPQDVAEARDALLEAEREYDRSKDSPRARSLAYVALRKAEAADARGTADLSARRFAEAQAALQEAQALQRQRVEAELEAARQQLAQAERERQEALAQQQRASMMAQSQQAEAERLRADAQRRQEEAERLRAQAQQRQSEAQRLQEETARRQTEEQRRLQAEAEAQRLAQQNQELQQRASQLEQERQARQQAEQQAEQERQARMEAERKATEALTRLDETAKDLKVREEERGLVVTLSGSVLFASNAVDLLPAARDRLTEVADVLKETQSPLLIEGHTDSQGPDAYNEDLSYRRAERVREFLTTQGVPAERIRIRGLGEYRPVATNASPEGRANNRRVEIIIEREQQRAVGGAGQGTGGAGSQQQPSQPSQPPQQQPSQDTGGTSTEPPQQQGTGGSGSQPQPIQGQGVQGPGTQGNLPRATDPATGVTGEQDEQKTPPSTKEGGTGGSGSGTLDDDIQEGVTPPQPGAQPGQSDTQPPR
ncbi:OmpA family protein [Pyxidicoccus fallax]|uniref:OmpA family protein n=1 Tax=Pyxidicoccus fallax TaxID=394095 RepID=A0A848LKV7_9BACT|nr:OmpA family protein [Pyxidicoccus fallax]NMO18417.1 OmpA family protein [Pyxidicoccus fallax]NPC78913.1 OmpA family protein [Pyxidicoccus fallax]